MFCKAYERKLRDAAAGGEELSGDLLQHARLCGDCAAEWEQEQALFAAMDLGLREAVNGEVPASLLAAVRQRVAAGEPQTIWWKPMLAFATAALAVGGIAVRITLYRPEAGGAAKQIVPATAPTRSEEVSSAANSATATETAPQRVGRQVRSERNEVAEDRQAVSASQILTSPVEVAGLKQYLQQRRLRTVEVAAKDIVKDDGPIGFQGIEIAEIDLGVMTIQPLDGTK